MAEPVQSSKIIRPGFMGHESSCTGFQSQQEAASNPADLKHCRAPVPSQLTCLQTTPAGADFWRMQMLHMATQNQLKASEMYWLWQAPLRHPS